MDFSTALKIAVKSALIAVVTAAIIVLFSSVQIPGLDFSFFSNIISKGLAIVYHWCPAASVIIPVSFSMYSLWLAIQLFEFAMIGVRWIFKVNE